MTTQTDLGDRIFIFYGKTLVDITNTGDIKTDSQYRNKRRNWEVLIQLLGLRTQIVLLNSPSINEVNLTPDQFGSDFTGTHYVWTFKFGVEHEHIFSNSTSEFGILYQDFNNVPIITGLSETAKFKLPVFNVSKEQRNIIFERERT
jgi:hypothetical protein